jgi:hypothetical protein
MKTIASTAPIAALRFERSSDEAACDRAGLNLYNAESALHAARQSGVDAWIAAAYGRLHEAILALDAAEAVLRHAS